jgi:DNA adenine methylase
MVSFIPYIGGKHRIAKRLAVYLQATGADTLVDVFGGSGAIIMNAGFKKRVYNEVDGDLVNLFRVIADRTARVMLLQKLRWRPPSRRIYEEDSEKYIRNRFSFSYLEDRVERAAATFYRHQFAFGGKVRSGGLSVSTTDRGEIKEIMRYRNMLRKVVVIGEFFRNTFIEELDFTKCVEIYGKKPNVVLFVDPPYVGTEWYYSRGGYSHTSCCRNSWRNARQR